MPKLSASEIAQAAKDAGFPADVLPKAVAIALAESGGDPSAKHRNMNGSTDYGLWQINSVHADILATGRWDNPADNARMATVVYVQANTSFKPWVTYTSGAYLAFIPAATRAVKGLGVDPDAQTSRNPLGLGVPFRPGDVAGAVSGPFGDIAALGTKALTSLTSADFWKRAGVFILGAWLLIVGLSFLLSKSQSGRAVRTAVTRGAL